MHPQIKHQVALMKIAISISDDIDTMERLLKPAEPIRFRVIKDELEARYLEVTQQLFSNFLTTANVVQQ